MGVDREYNVVNELVCSYSGAQQANCPPNDIDYTYDANGNLTNVENALGFGYDKRNRTASITPFAQTPIPFDYAGYSQSERLTRGSTSFTDTELGTQIEEQGGAQTFYDRTDQGQALAMRTPSAYYYYLFDSMGSTMALTDSSGDLAGGSRYRYEPYGEQVAGPSVANPIRFQGQYLDSQTGVYKMGLRYYDPTTMRWTQTDPLNLFQDPRQANRYAYAGADPVNQADPSGLDIIDDLGDLAGDLLEPVAAAGEALKLTDRVVYGFECADAYGKAFSGEDPFGTGDDPLLGACDPVNFIFGEPDIAR